MPIDYSKYPSNWKSEIRPRILERAKNKCECCGVLNYEYIFRGFLNDGTEVYQDAIGNIYDASNSKLIFTESFDFYIKPLSGKETQKAIKVVLTIAHLDHDETNQNVTDDRLKAMCQLCHLRYDSVEKKRRKELKKNQITLL